jgi:hypothetical protein
MQTHLLPTTCLYFYVPLDQKWVLPSRVHPSGTLHFKIADDAEKYPVLNYPAEAASPGLLIAYLGTAHKVGDETSNHCASIEPRFLPSTVKVLQGHIS